MSAAGTTTAAAGPAADAPPHLEGWLLKKAVRTLLKQNWKKRWCVFDGKARTLSYSKTQNGKPILIIPISAMSVAVKTTDHKKPFEFKVQTDALTFYACGASEAECDAWVAAISGVIEAMAMKSASASKPAAPPVASFGGGSSSGPAAGPRSSFAAAPGPRASFAVPSGGAGTAPAGGAGTAGTGPLGKDEPRELPPPPLLASKDLKMTDIVKKVGERSGKAMAFGANDVGQLGLGITNSSGHASAELVTALKLKNAPTYIAAGYRFAGALTAAEQLFMWGEGSAGQLGAGEDATRSTRPYLLPSLRTKRVLALACGGSHTLAIVAEGAGAATTSGEAQLVLGPLPRGSAVHSGSRGGVLYAWGTSHVGALGLGTSCTSIATPTPVPLPGVAATGDGALVTYIAAGLVSSAAVVDGRKLYQWGDAGYGRLGIPSPVADDDMHSRAVFNPCVVALKDASGGELTPQEVAHGATFTAYLGRSPAAPPGTPSILLVSGILGADASVYEDDVRVAVKGESYVKGGAVQVSVTAPSAPRGVSADLAERYKEISPTFPVPTPTATFGCDARCVAIAAGPTHYAVVVKEAAKDMSATTTRLLRAARKSAARLDIIRDDDGDLVRSRTSSAAAPLPPPPPPPGSAAGGAAAPPPPPPPAAAAPAASGAPVRVKNSVFTAGYGFLGHDYPSYHKYVSAEPQPVAGTVAAEDIAEVACGFYTTVARNTNGELFAWGANKYGGLNMGRYMDLPAPVMCVDPEDSHYSQIALGADFGFGLVFPGVLGDAKARKAARSIFGKWKAKGAARGGRKSVAAGDAAGLEGMISEIAADEGIADELKASGMSLNEIIAALLRTNMEAEAEYAAETAAKTDTAMLSMALEGDDATAGLLASLLAIDHAASSGAPAPGRL